MATRKVFLRGFILSKHLRRLTNNKKRNYRPESCIHTRLAAACSKLQALGRSFRNRDNNENEGQPVWADLLVNHSFFGLVRRRGLEPLCLAALAPQAINESITGFREAATH